MSDLRVLWLSHRDIMHPRAGGAERSAYEICRRLVSSGMTVTWMSSAPSPTLREEFIAGIHVVRTRSPLTEHLVAPILEISSPPPDVIVADLGHVVPWLSSRLTRVPGTVLFHHLHARTLQGQVPLPVARFLTWVERCYPRAFPDWDFVVTTPQSAADLEKLGVPRARCKVIALGVDSTRFVPGRRSDPPLLVYFGGLRPYKRADHSIRALACLKRQGTSAGLAFLGGGPALTALQALAKQLGVEADVHFLGKIADSDLAGLLATATVNLHCAQAEGWCLSALEAESAGVPTVAYDVPGLDFVVRDRISGVLCSDGNPRALAQATREILEGGYPDLPGSARRFASRFTWEATAFEWGQHLSRIAESAPKPKLAGPQND